MLGIPGPILFWLISLKKIKNKYFVEKLLSNADSQSTVLSPFSYVLGLEDINIPNSVNYSLNAKTL